MYTTVRPNVTSEDLYVGAMQKRHVEKSTYSIFM